jgi:hypothetical protein
MSFKAIKQWWEAEEYWIRGEACRNESDRPDIPKIVAAAEKRGRDFSISLRATKIALLALAREETISPEDRIATIQELTRRMMTA